MLKKINRPLLQETTINFLSTHSTVEGKVIFENISRVHGTLIGEVVSKPGSTLILCDSSIIEGNISADVLIVDGYVKGDISAKTKVTLSSTARVIGNIKTRSLSVEFGAYFEGNSHADPTLSL